MATERQISYIEQLAIDLQFDRHTRNTHIADKVGRNVAMQGLDSLTIGEASDMIDYFREMKYGCNADD